MATANATLTTAWTKLVDTGAEFFLSFASAQNQTTVELATTATDAAPTNLVGHAIRPWQNCAANRSLLGSGYVYGRVVSGGSVTAVVSTW